MPEVKELLEKLGGGLVPRGEATVQLADDIARALFGDMFTIDDSGSVKEALHGDINAAVALCGTVRPDWAWDVGHESKQPVCCANVYPTFRHRGPGMYRGLAATPALALLSALLRSFSEEG